MVLPIQLCVKITASGEPGSGKSTILDKISKLKIPGFKIEEKNEAEHYILYKKKG